MRPLLLCFLRPALLVAVLFPAAAPGAERAERVRSAGELRACIWPDYFGVSYRNPRTQELAGIDIDLAQALAKDLGVRVRFVDSSFATIADDLAADRCDVAMFAVGITPERRQRMAFTRPYLASDIYAITSGSNRRIRDWSDIDRPGVVVVVTRGTLHENAMREHLRQARLVVVETPHKRELEVASGRADVFMTDYPYSRRMLLTAEWARLVAPPKPFHVTPYAYAVALGDPRWLETVDAFVARIRADGRLAAAARAHGLDGILASD